MLNNQAKSAQAQLPIWVYLNPFCRVLTQANHLIKSGSDTRKLIHLQAHGLTKLTNTIPTFGWVLATFSLPLLMGSVVQHSHSKVNIVLFVLQFRSNFYAVLAKISVKKQVNSPYFSPSTSSNLSVFKKNTCILHHFAFLFWLPTHYFQPPITRFQTLKCHFVVVILPFLGMCFMAKKGFIYTITAYIYAYRLAFCSILPCVQHQNALRFAPNCLAFCTKLPCIQHQIALRFAPKRLAFSTKTHCILQQIALKLVQLAVALNIYSFCRIYKLAPFCIKTNLRENRFFAASWAVGE